MDIAPRHGGCGQGVADAVQRCGKLGARTLEDDFVQLGEAAAVDLPCFVLLFVCSGVRAGSRVMVLDWRSTAHSTQMREEKNNSLDRRALRVGLVAGRAHGEHV